MRYLTLSSLNICNNSLKSEFIRVFSFHTNPVIVNEFPSGLAALGSAAFLPFLNLPSAEFLMGGEFFHDPMGSIFSRWRGFHAEDASVLGTWKAINQKTAVR